jgi:hypothetical protein
MLGDSQILRVPVVSIVMQNRTIFSLHTTVGLYVLLIIYLHRIGDLRTRAEKSKRLPPVYKVSKTVYASPSRVNFRLDRRKAVETVPAYPNICFSVDDFDDPFDAVVLSDPEHCYCVILNAHDGAAFPEETESNNASSNIQPGANSGSSAENPPKAPSPRCCMKPRSSSSACQVSIPIPFSLFSSVFCLFCSNL